MLLSELFFIIYFIVPQLTMPFFSVGGTITTIGFRFISEKKLVNVLV